MDDVYDSEVSIGEVAAYTVHDTTNHVSGFGKRRRITVEMAREDATLNAPEPRDHLGDFLYTAAGRTESRAKTERTETQALKRFLAEHGASLATVDGKLLNVLERGYMNQVRARVPFARLVGVPANLDEVHWREYTRLYCAYLVAVGKLRPPTTVFVSVPGTRALRVCLLRVDSTGRLSLLY